MEEAKRDVTETFQSRSILRLLGGFEALSAGILCDSSSGPYFALMCKHFLGLSVAVRKPGSDTHEDECPQNWIRRKEGTFYGNQSIYICSNCFRTFSWLLIPKEIAGLSCSCGTFERPYEALCPSRRQGRLIFAIVRVKTSKVNQWKPSPVIAESTCFVSQIGPYLSLCLEDSNSLHPILCSPFFWNCVWFWLVNSTEAECVLRKLVISFTVWKLCQVGFWRAYSRK